MKFDKDVFINNLKKVSCRKKNLDIAADLNIDTTVISKWKSGAQTPTVDQLIHISEIYNCSIDDLLGIESDPAVISFSDILKKIFIFDMLRNDYDEYTQLLSFDIIHDKLRDDIVGAIKIFEHSTDNSSYNYIRMISEYSDVRKAFEHIKDINIRKAIIDNLVDKYIRNDNKPPAEDVSV